MFFSVHRPKTGGTSIQFAFTQAYGEEKILKLGKASTLHTNTNLLRLCLSNDSEHLFEILDSIAYVGGHANDSRLLWFKRNVDNINLALVIRDPISLFWSSYYQHVFGKQSTDITPERFLKKRSDSITWHRKKYSNVFGSEALDPQSKNFLYFFKYITKTSEISNSIPSMYEETREWLNTPRRQSADDAKKIRHHLQDDAEFNSLLCNQLSGDFVFYNKALSLIEEDKYTNTNYNQTLQRKKIKSFQKSPKPNSYIMELRELISWRLQKLEVKLKTASSEASKTKALANTRKWERALGNFGLSIEEFMSIKQ